MWQAVRAIEFYADHVLEATVPGLAKVRRKQGELVEREKLAAADASGVQTRDLVGRIDANEPEILQRMRRELRLGNP